MIDILYIKTFILYFPILNSMKSVIFHKVNECILCLKMSVASGKILTQTRTSDNSN